MNQANQVTIALQKGYEVPLAARDATIAHTTRLRAGKVTLESVPGALDERVRATRIDDTYSAIMVELVPDRFYYLHRVCETASAAKIAAALQIDTNPVTGQIEVREGEPRALAEAPAAPEENAGQPLITASVAELTGQLGIDEPLARAAVTVRSLPELVSAAQGAPAWQLEALTTLAGGRSLAETIETYRIEPEGDEHLVRGMCSEKSASRYFLSNKNEELARAIDEGDFASWRIFLHPDQRKYVKQDTNGPYRLTGGAGTGKSIILVHRAVRLARVNPQARIVLTTFTRNLADSLTQQVRQLDPQVKIAESLGEAGIYVCGADQLANEALTGNEHAPRAVQEVLGRHVSALTRVGITKDSYAWPGAIKSSGYGLPENLASRFFFESEYSRVILPQNILQQREYLRARRIGRGTKLGRITRAAVWRVIETYRLAAANEETYSFSEVPFLAARALKIGAEQDAGRRQADHVLIDEAQDLQPGHWQMMRELVAPGPNDIFIAQDDHQRIYGERIVLKHYGIEVRGRSRRLTLNYRTTAENLEYAMRILDGGDYAAPLEDGEAGSEGVGAEVPAAGADGPGAAGEPGAGGSVGTGRPGEERYRSVRSGAAPFTFHSDSSQERISCAAKTIRGWVNDIKQSANGGLGRGNVGLENIGILAPNVRVRDRIASALSECGVAIQVVDRNPVRAGVPVVMSMHRSKGIEFSRVLLFEVGEISMPRGVDYDDEARREAELRERSLLYVAASRARDELAVIWGKKSKYL
ncbi:UvrD-helicase domain-containing protein [Dermabacteraceae bacterium P13077]